MSSKFALIIANTEYTDPGLAQLTAPGRDAKDFGQALDSPEICAFDDVVVLVNESSYKVGEAIDYFLSNRKPDDLLVLYFSGHGVRDEYGSLYLAVKNTNRARLRSTAIKSDFIREAMDQSRSKRQVLILDCCNSGAFTQGTKAATGVSLGTASAFEAGYGRIILTASDSTQYAWEGDKVIGETDNSLFTHFLVEGLEGRADLNGDGQITVDELYEYAYEKVKLATPKQTPSKFSSKQQGEIILRESMRIEDIRSVPLPAELINAIENPLPFVREGAVRQLEGILKSKNIGLARSAREALERMEREDDSRRVSKAATQVLETVRQTEKAEEERKAREEVERMAAQRAEEDRIALKKAETERWLAQQKVEEERKSRNEADRLAALKTKEERLACEKEESEHKAQAEAQQWVTERAKEAERKASQSAVEKNRKDASLSSSPHLWFTLSWVIAGFIGGAVYWTGGDYALQLGAAVGWGIGGFITAITLRTQKVLASGKNIYMVTLAWIIGGIIGWTAGDWITEAYGAAIGGAIGLVIALVGTFGVEKLFSRWKNMLWLILVWAIASAVGWSVGKGVQDAGGNLSNLYIGKAAGWGLGMAFTGVLGGYVLGWQLLKNAGKSSEQIADPAQPSQIDLITFLLSWKGRLLLGATLGIILGIMHNSIIDFFALYTSLALLVACSLAGLITYPHKLSIALLVTGFFVVGYLANSVYLEIFIANGGIGGIPAAALISRILYWLKVIK